MGVANQRSTPSLHKRGFIVVSSKHDKLTVQKASGDGALAVAAEILLGTRGAIEKPLSEQTGRL